MLTTRVSATLPDTIAALATEIEHAVRSHALARSLQGTVLIGTGDPFLVRPDDIVPLVVVPLAWPQRPNPVGLAQVAAASALVLLHPAEVGRVGESAFTCPIVLIAAQRDGAEQAFLRGAEPYETMEALATLNKHTALRTAIEQRGRRLPDSPVNPDAVAAAVIEAIVATDDRPPVTTGRHD